MGPEAPPEIHVVVPDQGTPAQARRPGQLAREAFGEAGLVNTHLLVPFVRHGRVFALRVAGELHGAAELVRDWADRACAYLFGVRVDRRHAGRGLGTRFLLACLQRLAGEGMRGVPITVDPANGPALAVSRKLGFEAVAREPDLCGPGEDRASLSPG